MRPSLETTFREAWPRAVAILTRVLGDLALAEDAVQEAFVTAAERWPRDGMPRSPGAWIVTTARNRAIDRIRRERTFVRKAELLARLEDVPADEDADVSSIPDERLALLFRVVPVGGETGTASPAGPARRRWKSAGDGLGAHKARQARSTVLLAKLRPADRRCRRFLCCLAVGCSVAMG